MTPNDFINWFIISSIRLSYLSGSFLGQEKREEIREGDIGADLRIDLKSFVEISDGSFPTSLRIHCHRSVNFFNNSLIRMLCYVVGFAKD